MPGPNNVSVKPNSLRILPGNYAEATIEVQNTGDVVDVLSLAIHGLDLSWIQLSTISFSLYPGDSGTSVLKVCVPRTSASSSKSYVVTVETKSRNYPSCSQNAVLVLDVDPFHSVEARVREETLASGRSTYLIDVENQGNSTVTYRFAGTPQGWVEPLIRTSTRWKWKFEFTPTQLKIVAGATGQLSASVFATLNDRPKLGLRQDCECELKVQPTPANGSTAIVVGHLKTSPILHLWVALCLLIGIVFAISILALLVFEI
jgi:hypothetical protein